MANHTVSFFQRLAGNLHPLRSLWRQRQHVARGIHGTGHCLNRLYQALPIPSALRTALRELTYHSIEQFIVRSTSYQDWLAQGGGLSRLHHLLRIDAPSDAALTVTAPTDSEWRHLLGQFTPLRPNETPTLCVILPVYAGYDETLRCIYSVRAAKTAIPYRLIVINDASPDDRLTEQLDWLHQRGLFELITHDTNQGFVRTVNEGMALYPAQDVVLLNADTLVCDDWLDRLHTALQQNDTTASVTPWSNNADLCNYPTPFCISPALEMDHSELNRLLATHSPTYPALPTAVGFCMAIKRAALEQVGDFDAQAFGRGYGEENDWCLRASKQGWQHILADNCFVWHHGGVSFSTRKRWEQWRSRRTLNQRWPHYRALIRQFRKDDPLLPIRRHIDILRLKQLGHAESFLFLNHRAGGGTEQHVHEMTARLGAEGITVYRLSPDPQRPTHVTLWHEAVPHCPNLSFDIDHEQQELAQCLKTLGILRLHIHHLLGFPPRTHAWISRCSKQLGIAYDITLHDYYLACPSINLLYDQPYYDQLPTLAQSEHWVQQHPTDAGRTPVWYWRWQHQQLLEGARQVIAPSQDCADRIQQFFPTVDVFIRPHPEQWPDEPINLFIPHQPDEPLNIAIIGHLTPHKGLHIVQNLAEDAQKRHLPIIFHIFGHVETEKTWESLDNTIIHGAYAPGTINQRLTDHPCHIAFIASTCPETYSYTLSIALMAQLYPICFDLGAPAQRLRDASWGTILPRDLIANPTATNNALLTLETTPAPDNLADRAFIRYATIRRDYYGR